MDNKAYSRDGIQNNDQMDGSTTLQIWDTSKDTNGYSNGHSIQGNGHVNGSTNGHCPSPDDVSGLESANVKEARVEEIQQQLRDREPMFFCRWITKYPKSFFGKFVLR